MVCSLPVQTSYQAVGSIATCTDSLSFCRWSFSECWRLGGRGALRNDAGELCARQPTCTGPPHGHRPLATLLHQGCSQCSVAPARGLHCRMCRVQQPRAGWRQGRGNACPVQVFDRAALPTFLRAVSPLWSGGLAVSQADCMLWISLAVFTGVHCCCAVGSGSIAGRGATAVVHLRPAFMLVVVAGDRSYDRHKNVRIQHSGTATHADVCCECLAPWCVCVCVTSVGTEHCQWQSCPDGP